MTKPTRTIRLADPGQATTKLGGGLRSPTIAAAVDRMIEKAEAKRFIDAAYVYFDGLVEEQGKRA